MNSPLLIGLGAGLVTAVLFASTMTGGLLAFLLFYIIALPGFLAGLGWGSQSALVAGLTGAGMTGALLEPVAGLGVFLTFGLPITVLCYLALLARPVEESESAGAKGPDGMEWYPIGRIVACTAVMAGVVASLSVPLFGADVETYRTSLQEILDKTFFSRMPEGAPEGLDKEKLKPVMELLIRSLPAALAIVWFGVMLLNMWAAGRIAFFSGRLIRPWPDISTMNYPASLALGFVAALLGTFAPGILSVVATGFAGAFLIAYVLLGLVVVHVMARRTAFRYILLGTLYLGMFMFGWVALVVAILGIGEPIFKLRERALNAGPPSQND